MYAKVIRDTQKSGRKANREAGKSAAEKLAKNPAAKMRPADKPYASWTCAGGRFEYRLHKSYQNDNAKTYARWMVAVRSPYTFGSWELGDEYVEEALARLDIGSVQCDLTIWNLPADFLAWALGKH